MIDIIKNLIIFKNDLKLNIFNNYKNYKHY